MTKSDAHRLLDDARAGRPISSKLIGLALQATGDIVSWGNYPVQTRVPVGSWERPVSQFSAKATPFDGLMA